MLKSTHLKMELDFFARLAAGRGGVSNFLGRMWIFSFAYVRACQSADHKMFSLRPKPI